jgi:hypothetical protein
VDTGVDKLDQKGELSLFREADLKARRQDA